MKYFDKEKSALLHFHDETRKNFWDKHWLKILKKDNTKIYNFNPKLFLCRITPLFLNPDDGPILEGGCGLGQYVYFLKTMKYDAIGIDNARKIIEKLNKEFPFLNVRVGNVRQLQFPNNYFAGYWSLGVIEHFYNGYYDVLKEMKRVIKPNGILFITVPYMSPFRKLKLILNLYKIFNNNFYKKYKKPKIFYQFIFDKDNIIKEFIKLGFKIRYQEPLGGIKGFKDENFFFKFCINRFLQLLYNLEKPRVIVLLKSFIDKVLSKFSGHIILLVFQKT